MDATKRINDLIVISENLADLLARENRALRDHKNQEVATLVEQKDALSRAYETRIEGLAEHAADEDVGAVDQMLRDRLRGLGVEVQGLMEENLQLLNVAIEVNRRVLENVAEAVKVSQPGPGVYSQEGTVDAGKHRAAPKNIPLSIDRSL